VPQKAVLNRIARALCFCAVLFAAACATKKVPTPLPPPQVIVVLPPEIPKATPGLLPAQRMKKVIELAARGDYPMARLEIEAYLLERPNSDLGQSLKRQLFNDPIQDLGIRSFRYVIKPGETLATIAERLMGDRYQFVGLARYNSILVPERAQAGQVIQIPGEPPAKVPDERAVSDDTEIDKRLAQESLPKVPPPPPQPKLPTVDEIIRAGKLRLSALEQLQRGFADRAAVLLEEALKLYPTSVKIIRDLDRARRLQALSRKTLKP
jgi:LysM domain